MSLDANWYMRSPIQLALREPFVANDQKEFAAAMSDFNSAKYPKALERLKTLADRHPLQFAVRLMIVRCHCEMGHGADAALALGDLRRTGWRCRSALLDYKEIRELQSDSAMQIALGAFAENELPYLPSQAFYRRLIWGPNGGINGVSDQGRQFVLSTVLAVTHNNGNSLDEALRQIRLSVAADASQPSGTFYFSSTNNIRRAPGNRALPMRSRG